VKKAVQHVLIYIFFFVMNLLILVGLVLLYRSVIFYSPAFGFQKSLLSGLPSLLLVCLPVATAGSLFLILLVRARSQGRNLLSAVFVVITAVVLYTGPGYVLLKMETTPSSLIRFPLEEGKITQLGEKLLYSQTFSGTEDGEDITELRNNAVIQIESEAPRISFYPQLVPRIREQKIYKTDTSLLIDYQSSPRVTETLILPSDRLGRLTDEISALTDGLGRALDTGIIAFLIYAISQVLFLSGSWAVIRTSRWPLWNALLVLIFFRGFFRLDAVFRSDTVREGLRILSLEKHVYLAPSAGFLLLAVLFFLWGIFFFKPDSLSEAQK